MDLRRLYYKGTLTAYLQAYSTGKSMSYTRFRALAMLRNVTQRYQRRGGCVVG